MARYVIKAWSGDDVHRISHVLNDSADRGRSITVFDPEGGPVSTGLVDHRGTTIFRLPDTHPIGFHKPRR